MFLLCLFIGEKKFEFFFFHCSCLISSDDVVLFWISKFSNHYPRLFHFIPYVWNFFLPFQIRSFALCFKSKIWFVKTIFACLKFFFFFWQMIDIWLLANKTECDWIEILHTKQNIYKQMKKKLVKRDLNNLGLDFGFGNFCFFPLVMIFFWSNHTQMWITKMSKKN